MLPELLNQIPQDQEIATVTADGAFDTRKCHDAIAARGAAAFGHALTPAPQERQTLEARHPRGVRHRPRTDGGRCLTPQRDPAHFEARRSDDLATMVRGQPATGPRAAPNAITAEAEPKPGCTASSCWVSAPPHSGSTVRLQSARSVSCASVARSDGATWPVPQRINRARHTHHRGRRIGLSGERGRPPITRFVQQNRISREPATPPAWAVPAAVLRAAGRISAPSAWPDRSAPAPG